MPQSPQEIRRLRGLVQLEEDLVQAEAAATLTLERTLQDGGAADTRRAPVTPRSNRSAELRQAQSTQTPSSSREQRWRHPLGHDVAPRYLDAGCAASERRRKALATEQRANAGNISFDGKPAPLPSTRLVEISRRYEEERAAAVATPSSSARTNRAAELRRLHVATPRKGAELWRTARATTRAARVLSSAVAEAGCVLHVRGIGSEYQNAHGVGKYEREDELRKVFSRYGEFVSAAVRHRVDEDGNNTSW